MKSTNDEALLTSVTNTLDDSVDHLDANTLSRLNQARQRALDGKRRSFFSAFWLPATSFASISVVIFAGWLFFTAPQTSLDNFNDAELVAASEDLNDEKLELLEDMEFVSWLLEEENAS